MNDENLTPFTSEHQPKNRGRKKGSKSMTTILKKYLKGTLDGDDLPARDRVALEMIKKAIDGDVQAMKYIFDRIDGKPKETVDQNIKGDLFTGPIEIKIVKPDD